jgi:hypothetical protein
LAKSRTKAFSARPRVFLIPRVPALSEGPAGLGCTGGEGASARAAQSVSGLLSNAVHTL